jgi:hypothetical protein
MSGVLDTLLMAGVSGFEEVAVEVWGGAAWSHRIRRRLMVPRDRCQLSGRRLRMAAESHHLRPSCCYRLSPKA